MESSEFFAQFTEYREQKELTIEDIEQEIKINGKYLRAIENGDLSFLPPPYVTAFVKSYAKVLGMDVALVLKELDTIRKKPEAKDEPDREDFYEQAEAETQLVEKSPLHSLLPKSSRDWYVAIGTLAGVLIVFWLVFSGEDRKPVEPFVVNESDVKALTDSLREKYAASTVQTAAPADSRPQPARMQSSGAVRLEIVGRETTWILISVDNDTTFDFFVRAGERLSYSAQDSLTLRIGKAQGVELFLNGENLGELGPEHMLVLDMLLTPRGMERRRLARRPESQELPIQQ